jgi:hypothetical protein
MEPYLPFAGFWGVGVAGDGRITGQWGYWGRKKAPHIGGADIGALGALGYSVT